MKRLLLALAALTCAGCFDYDYAISVCHDSGGCRPVDDAGSGDAGGTDAGGTDAGGTDAGSGEDAGGVDAGSDAGTPDAGGQDASIPQPVFTTSGGWGWEFPFPAGGPLHSVAAISDDEVWAAGEDNAVLHYLRGELTFYRLEPPNFVADRALVVPLADGGVLVVGKNTLYERTGSTWMNSAFPYTASVAKLGANGVPWFGAMWIAGTGGCSSKGAAIIEGYPSLTAVCTGVGNDTVVAIDPQGWALEDTGRVLRRETDGGWTPVARAPSPTPRADLLALTPTDLVVAGTTVGNSYYLHLDGGSSPLTAPALVQSWTGLAPRSDQPGFFLAGDAGVFRCAWPAQVCTLDLANDAPESLSRGPTTLFAVGPNGQLLRRSDAGWSTLHEGAADSLNDVWADPNGEFWAVENKGFLMHRDRSGWERLPAANSPLYSITRTTDDTLWVCGPDLLGYYDPNTKRVVSVDAWLPDGGSFTLAGKTLFSLGGREPGNTWAVGDGMLLRYEGARVWRSTPFPTANGTSLEDLFVTDAGTAWAVGGTTNHVVLHWNGSSWLDRTPDAGSTDELHSVWGPSSTEVFISSEGTGGYHFFTDGGVVGWPVRALALTGGATGDGGYVLFAGFDKEVRRFPNGVETTRLPDTYPSDGPGFSRIRLLGSKLYAVGARSQSQSFMLSYDAGL